MSTKVARASDIQWNDDPITLGVLKKLKGVGDAWTLSFEFKENDPRISLFLKQDGFRIISEGSAVYTAPDEPSISISIQFNVEPQLGKSKINLLVSSSRHIPVAELRNAIVCMCMPLVQDPPLQTSGDDSSQELKDLEAGVGRLPANRRKGLSSILEQSGVSVPSYAPADADKYGVSPKPVHWLSVSEEVDPVRRALMTTLLTYTRAQLSEQYSIDAATIWSFLFHQLPPPSIKTISSFCRLTGLEKEEFFSYLFKNYFYKLGLSGLCKRQGNARATFFIDALEDGPLLKCFNKEPGTLGEALWFTRKVKGLDVDSAASVVSIRNRKWTGLERNEKHNLGRRDIIRLASFLGISIETFDEKYGASITKRNPYDQAPKKESEIGFIDTAAVANQAIGKLAYEQVATRMVAAFEKYLGNKVKIGPKAADSILNMKIKNVADEYLAAFLLAFGHKLSSADRARFWMGIFGNEMASAIPGFDPANPRLVVPRGTTLVSLFSFSIPETLTRLYYQPQVTLEEVGSKIGVDRLTLQNYSAMNYPIKLFDKLVPMASTFGLTPDLLYLYFNPWTLFAVPVVTEDGVVLNDSEVFPDAQVVSSVKKYQEALRYGRGYLDEYLKGLAQENGFEQNKGELKGAFYKRVLLSVGFPPNLAAKFTHPLTLPNHDDLIIAVNHLPGIDKQKFVESYKLGELRVMLGTLPDGSIDYKKPPFMPTGVNEIVGILEVIKEKLGSEEPWDAFWIRNDFHIFKTLMCARSNIIKGLSAKQIFMLGEMATKAGIELVDKRNLYWFFYGDFLSQFLPQNVVVVSEFQPIEEGLSRYLYQTGLEVPAENADKKIKYGISPKPVEWFSLKDETNPIRRTILEFLDAHLSEDFSRQYGMQPEVFWRFLFHYLPPPSKKSIEKMAQITGLRVKDFYRYFFDNYFAELKLDDVCERQGSPNAVFPIQILYDGPLVKAFNEAPSSLGEALWFNRKINSLTGKEAAHQVHMALSKWEALEKNESVRLGRRDIQYLTNFLGVSVAEFNTWYQNRGGDKSNVRSQLPVDTENDYLEASAIARKVIRRKPYEQIAKEMNRVMARYMGETVGGIGVKTVTIILNGRFKNVSDENLMAFLLAFGRSISHEDRLKFWMGAYGKDIEQVIPDFDVNNPKIVVPDGTNLEALFSFSVSEAIVRLSLEPKRNMEFLAEQSGLDVAILRNYARMNYSTREIDKLNALADTLGVTPGILYLYLNPASLLFIPVVTASGELLNQSAHFPDEKITSIIRSYRDQRRNGREYVWSLLESAPRNAGLVQDEKELKRNFVVRALVFLGFSKEMAVKYAHPQQFPNDEELIFGAAHLPGVDKKRLAESYKLGELSLMLGKNADGSIDWSEPVEDLSDMPQRIREAIPVIRNVLGEGVSSDNFWKQYELSCFRIPSTFTKVLEQGLTLKQIYILCVLAERAGVNLKRRDLYWYFNGDFLRHFIGADQPETPSPSSVSSVSLPTAFPASREASVSPSARGLPAKPAPKTTGSGSKGGGFGTPQAMFVEGGAEVVGVDNLVHFPIAVEATTHGILMLAVQEEPILMPNVLVDEDVVAELEVEPANNANYHAAQAPSPQALAPNLYPLAGMGVMGLFANPAVSFAGLGLPALPGVLSPLGR